MDDYDLIIEPKKSINKYWKEVWKYRELFYFLAWKDILIQYKQTVIGILWSIVNPLSSMLIFTFIFSKVAKLPDNGIPYPIIVFAGILPWQLFANSLSMTSNSLIENSGMLSKIYFPRIIIPSSKIIVSLVDSVISFSILLLLMVFYKQVPGLQIFIVPVLILLTVFLALGMGFWFSALSVKYRDFRYIVPFIIQFGLYISPVGFNTDVIPESLKIFYSLNPMVGIIDGFRYAICKTEFNLNSLLLSLAISFILFFSGLTHFRKTEKIFADII